MLVQDIYLTRVEWHIRVYYAITRCYADEIIDSLIRIGCNGDNLKEAKRCLWENKINSGLTYSNIDRLESVVVINKSSSPAEYYNSIDHEKLHLLQHIGTAYGIDPYGEEIAYICGDISSNMFKYSKKLLCECCLNKLKKERR